MGEVDGYLSFFIRGGFALLSVGLLGEYLAYAEFACYAKRDGSDDCSWAEIGELIAVVAYTFGASVVTVYKGSIGFPRVG